MRPGRQALVALAAAAVLAMAGCGGGGDEETTEAARPQAEEPQRISKAELLSEGDAICAEVNAAVGTVGSSSSEAGQEGRVVADIYLGMVEDLKGLGAPSEAEGYAELMEAAEVLAQAEDEAKLAFERGDTAALESAEASAATALSEFQAAASAYGFEECGEEPSVPAAPVGGEAGEAAGEAPEAAPSEEAVVPEVEEEAAPEVEEVAPETGGAGEVAPEAGGGTAPEVESGGSSGGVGPG